MTKEYLREWRQKNKTRLREYNRTRYREQKVRLRAIARQSVLKLKIEVLSHYCRGTPKCKCCGEKEIVFLTLDHLNGGGRVHREKVGYGSKLHRWLKKNNYPKGLQVLCYNCNCGRQINGGKCPHKNKNL